MGIAAALRQTSQVGIEPEPATPVPPLWRESLWAVDWFALHFSPVYYGRGVPAGDGSAVVTVPGFMCSDVFMFELNGWLRRIGYRPYSSGVGVNADCPGELAERLADTVARAVKETGRQVRIVGHSLGGILGRRVAIERPEHVSQLVYLGTPLKAVHAHPGILAAGTMLYAAGSLVKGRDCHCFTAQCECGFTRRAAEPLPTEVRHAAIYTRYDGVVDWHDATEQHPRLNHEVGGTHVGLPYNPRAYKVLAHILQDRRRPV
jgi:pimeloyl-ACP methyl ester carboxylesterase